MFTNKDVEFRSVYVINCITERELRVSNGELLLEEKQDKKILTKLPFQKILALIVVGHIHITTPLIEKCKKFNVALVVLKASLRPVFFWADSAEGNFLVRKKQYEYDKEDISIARILVINKIANGIELLKRTRKKDEKTLAAIDGDRFYLERCRTADKYNELMGIEGSSAKLFFSAYFQDFNWTRRMPRTKCDYINSILDIGYTYLFNFIECFVRMFGFDIYIGVYHRLWFKRKSLICDLMEPFRCIIDLTVRTSINRGQFTLADFELYKGEYRLKRDCNMKYSKIFFDALVPHKMDIFKYVQTYYRAFMKSKTIDQYPRFNI